MAYILRSLLSVPPTSSARRKTILHMQDYNLSVLQLVTLPNLLLAALPFLLPASLDPPNDAVDLESAPSDLTRPGDLNVTPAFKKSFKKMLEEKSVDLTFSYGHWSGFARNLREEGGDYGLVMTAETIYANGSVEPLIDVLRAAICRKKKEHVGRGEIGLEERIGKLDMADGWAKTPLREVQEGMTMVAAKVSCWDRGINLCSNGVSSMHDLHVCV